MITKYNKQPIEVNSVKGIHCIFGKSEKFEIRHGSIKSMSIIESPEKELPYIGPGLIDLQVNGINGIDFNDITLTQNDFLEATRYLLSTGVTIFFPTVITNSDDSILQILKTIFIQAAASMVYLFLSDILMLPLSKSGWQ